MKYSILRFTMIHLLFFGIISTDLLCALPTGMTSVKPLTNDSHRSVQISHTARKIVFPSKKDQQSLLIGCILHRDRKNEDQRRDCKELNEKKKNILYQFNDRSFEEQNPLQDNDQQPIHLNPIKKPGNNSVDEGYQWLSNDDMMEETKEILPWETQDSLSDRNDDDSKTIEDFHAWNRKSTFLHCPIPITRSKIFLSDFPFNISQNSTEETIDGTIHLINQTVFLSDLVQAFKTLETIINDEPILLPSSEKFSWKFLQFFKSHSQHPSP